MTSGNVVESLLIEPPLRPSITDQKTSVLLILPRVGRQATRRRGPKAEDSQQTEGCPTQTQGNAINHEGKALMLNALMLSLRGHFHLSLCFFLGSIFYFI